MSLILASSSIIRTQLLSSAGVAHEVRAPSVDEGAIKQAHVGGGLALTLAKAKAESVAGDWVIGSDSTISVDGRPYSKPSDRAEAAEHLAAFSGRTLVLESAVALAQGGRCEWSHSDTATLDVRDLSSSFIDSYLDTEWPEVAYCVGVFRIEGRGVTLFERISGDHFTILGLPLLPLLGALRERGLIAS
ncbi:MAG TPA: nucleoside triphosphate pyrophosphatase [Sphingomicrobium sp.]|nr:nucleoside triphosphate pyrophosphatase [Sphingomicrobium sp.]